MNGRSNSKTSFFNIFYICDVSFLNLSFQIFLLLRKKKIDVAIFKFIIIYFSENGAHFGIG